MPPKPRSESPTMSDVARMAGVSQSCVSLVLNDAPGSRVPERTRERVLRAASTLNYSLPHRGPRPSSELAPVAKRTIAFVTDEISISPHTVLQINGVRDSAWAQEFVVQTYVTRSNKALEDATISAVLSDAAIAGLIYTNSFTRELELSTSLRTIPTVLVNCYMKTALFPTLLADDVGGGRAATEHLIQLGHERIAMITGERWMDASTDRQRGYREALTSAGIEYDVSLLRYGDWSVASGYKRTLSLMGRPNPPTAIYCASDLMALGCFQALNSLGLSIPSDVSVVGHNDIDLAQYLDPALTSCRPPNYELGQRAVEILLDIVQGVDEHEAVISRLDSKLILRSSAAAPANHSAKVLNGNRSRALASAANESDTASRLRSATPSR
jgi:LacI family transcriptional regulator